MLVPLNWAPGVTKNDTPYSQPGRYTDTQWMRFEEGRPESIPGFVRQSDEAFVGIARSALPWRAHDGDRYIGIGTHKRLYAYQGGEFVNITPWRSAGTTTNPFVTTASSSVVTVNHTSHGVGIAGEYVFVGTATTTTQAGVAGTSTVNGLLLAGEYAVTTVVDDNSYRIAATGTATANGTGGGTGIVIRYELNPGQQDGAQAFGYGAGPYGESTYGTPRSTGIPIDPRIWQLDLWGENLLAAYKGGNLYEWDVDGGARAATVSNAPTGIGGFFVTAERHVVALKEDTVYNSDQENNTDWTASATDQAGDITVQVKSSLFAGRRWKDGANLFWSEAECYAQQYTADRFVFAFRKQGDGNGLLAPMAVAQDSDGVLYWMTRSQFVRFNGFVEAIPNQGDMRDFVFEGMNLGQQTKCFAAYNSLRREVWFFYPSTDSDEIDRYVLVSIDSFAWANGTVEDFPRTAWADAGVFDRPILAGTDGYLYAHESGEDANGAALLKSIQTGLVEIQDGNPSMDIFGFIPDMRDQAGDVDLVIVTQDKPNSPQVESETFTLATDTERVDTREHGRAMALRWSSETLGGRFRLGQQRVDVQPAGIRR